MKRIFSCLVRLVIALAFVVSVSTAALGDDFYEGKTFKIIVGYSPGGGFDAFSRVVGRHISKYIPGHPTIIVQNMPGAGSVLAANRVYAMQPGDGLTMVTFNASFITRAVLKVPGIRFDPQKFIWIGQPSVGAMPQTLWFRPEVIKSFDELLQVKKPVHMGSAGPGDSMWEMAEFYKGLGLKVKNVTGYKGSADILAATERGELDGFSISAMSMQGVYSHYLRIVVPIASLGTHPMVEPVPGVPAFEDIVKLLKLSKENVALGRFLMDNRALLRVFAVPPGTPPERVEMLRTAFAKALRDPKLLEDAKRLKILVAPLSGKEVEEKIESLINTSPEVLEIYRKRYLSK